MRDERCMMRGLIFEIGMRLRDRYDRLGTYSYTRGFGLGMRG